MYSALGCKCGVTPDSWENLHVWHVLLMSEERLEQKL